MGSSLNLPDLEEVETEEDGEGVEVILYRL